MPGAPGSGNRSFFLLSLPGICRGTPDLYELEDESGEKHVFELLDAMEYEGEKYYALTPYFEDPNEALEAAGDLVILRSDFDENNEEILSSIEDDDEFEKIGEIFLKRIDEMFDFEDDENEVADGTAFS